MTKPKTLDELFEGREIRRAKQEDRFMAKLDRRMDAAEALIGHLQGEKGFRYYINIRSKTGRLTGAIKEFATKLAATDYLLRNRYV